ncbi:AMP-binding protein [Variovorax paradoxus]|nr:AMP-binding protein [Variovorax paradoxus]
MSADAGSEAVHSPIRNLADIEAIEAIPFEQRVAHWDFGLNLLEGCAIDPGKPALIATDRGNVSGELRTWSYGELAKHSVAVANLLRASGVGEGDAVAIVSPTVPGLYAALIGGFLAARPFPINWLLEPQALADLLGAVRPKAVIALAPTDGFLIWDNVRQAVSRLADAPALFSLHDPFAPAGPLDLLAAAQAHAGEALAFSRPQGTAKALAAYMHSGGTTGRPKIVKITHGGLLYRQWTTRTNIGRGGDADNVVLSDTPLFHIGGLSPRGLVPIAAGMSVVIPSIHGARDKRYMSNYWRYVERFGITLISGVPTTLGVLAKNPPQGEDLSSLRPRFFTGSTGVAIAVQQRIEEITGARALMTYGLTENTSNATADPREGEMRPGCSGLRVPYTELRIVRLDDNGDIAGECGTDEPGTIVVRGPGVSPGYLDPAQDDKAFLPDGSFVTGDIGSLDADGYLRVSGRRRDLIIRGGHNIEPAHIEEALLALPAVAAAAAVGRPDAHAGEVPVVYVELRPGATASPEELLREAAARILEPPAVPKEIFIVERIPLTAVGKPIKAELREDAARRVFTALLAPLADRCSIDLFTNKSGAVELRVRVFGDGEAATREAVSQRLADFTVRHAFVQAKAFAA